VFEQAEELKPVFIRHALVVGRQPPVGAKLFTRVQAEGQVGVAEVNGEEHGDVDLRYGFQADFLEDGRNRFLRANVLFEDLLCFFQDAVGGELCQLLLHGFTDI